MLGETVLSLLIIDLSDRFDYFVTFFIGVVSIILLEYLHFRSQPHDPNEHAIRRDKTAGVIFNVMMSIYSVSLVILGTSYKMLLYENVYAADGADRRMLFPMVSRLLAGGESAALRFDTEDRRQYIAHFFSGSMALVFFSIDATAINHRGLVASMGRCECKDSHTTRYWVVFLVFIRVLLIGFIATLSQYTTSPDTLAFVGLCGILAQLVLRVLGSFAFPVDQEAEEDKLLERMAMHATARLRE